MAEDVVRALGHLTLGSRLKRIGERLQAQTQVLLLEDGIAVPAAQMPVLATLDRSGPASIGDIAQALGVAQPGVTRMIGKLAAAGLVAAQQPAGDRRVRTVALTREGARLVAAAKRAVWPRVEAAVAEACAGPPRALLDQLAALEDALEAASLQQRAARIGTGRRRHARATA